MFASISVTPTVGAGYITGNRAFKSDPASYRKLAAQGLEVGFELGYDISQRLRAEAYFNYLFAFKADMVLSGNKSPSLKKIPSDMKYTDYKAGLGLGYFIPLNENNSFRISSGINFAGISNHKYSSAEVSKKIENQIGGNKVTSFGFYLNLAGHHHFSDKLDFVASVHGLYNTFGWIRTFENNKWVNHFNKKSEIELLSIFAKMGLCISFL